jgi:hypothetical protein
VATAPRRWADGSARAARRSVKRQARGAHTECASWRSSSSERQRGPRRARARARSVAEGGLCRRRVCRVLGGLIGLGPRAPSSAADRSLRFLAVQAVILAKAMSLVVVATALRARLLSVPLDAGRSRQATSDPTKGRSGPHRADSLKESQLAARSGVSPPRRSSPTRRIEPASLQAAARRCELVNSQSYLRRDAGDDFGSQRSRMRSLGEVAHVCPNPAGVVK